MRFSVCALFYGDYPDLARRCLASLDGLAATGLVADVRLGFNRVSTPVAAFAESWAQSQLLPVYGFFPVSLCVNQSFEFLNVGKYPLMRRMFYPAAVPALAELVFWLDDDSRLCPGGLTEIARFFDNESVVLAGEPWYACYRGHQEEHYQVQPWFTGRVATTPVNSRRIASREFAQGGGWQARTAFLARWDYPFPELRHNGGDVALGRLVFEQDGGFFRHRVGAVCNTASRRGLTEPPAWSEPGSRQPEIYHAFAHCEVLLNDRAQVQESFSRWVGEVIPCKVRQRESYLCTMPEGQWPRSYFV